MKTSKLLAACIGAAAISFSIAAYAAPAKDKSKETAAPAAEKKEEIKNLKAKRDGDKVKITWTLPEGNWRSIDILRNDKEATKSRTRIKNVRASVTTYTDQVPDQSQPYWYWLKVASNDNKVINIGPVKIED